MEKYPAQYYRDYLQLDKILDAQAPVSDKYGIEAHDEMLFIITHQTYELWFKQVLFELESARETFKLRPIPEPAIGTVLHRAKRVNKILELLAQQFSIIETMSSMDFMDFRELLNPASGFQSLQFRLLEVMIGLEPEKRLNIGRDRYHSRLDERDRTAAENAHGSSSLFELVEQWLENMPFMEENGYTFWESYKESIGNLLERDKQRLRESYSQPENIALQMAQIDETMKNFDSLFDEAKYEELLSRGVHRLSLKATRAALFIYVYRDYPLLQLPYNLLAALVEMDELLAIWRYRHALMVARMIGTRIGTGGSSGHGYLLETAAKHKVFADISNVTSFLIPRRETPDLPENVAMKLRFVFGE